MNVILVWFFVNDQIENKFPYKLCSKFNQYTSPVAILVKFQHKFVLKLLPIDYYQVIFC